MQAEKAHDAAHDEQGKKQMQSICMELVMHLCRYSDSAPKTGFGSPTLRAFHIRIVV